MFRNALEPWHIIVLVLVFMLIFGSKKLPDAARGLGRSMRIFKSEMKAMGDDGKASPQVEVKLDEPVKTGETASAASGETRKTEEHKA